MSRPTRTERRRAQLALRISSLEAMESRNLITESLGILSAGIGLPAALMAVRAEAGQAAQVAPTNRRAMAIPDLSAVSAPKISIGGVASRSNPNSPSSIPTTVADISTFDAIPKPNQIRMALSEGLALIQQGVTEF